MLRQKEEWQTLQTILNQQPLFVIIAGRSCFFLDFEYAKIPNSIFNVRQFVFSKQNNY